VKRKELRMVVPVKVSVSAYKEIFISARALA
jgi:hypothetical protein